MCLSQSLTSLAFVKPLSTSGCNIDHVATQIELAFFIFHHLPIIRLLLCLERQRASVEASPVGSRRSSPVHCVDHYHGYTKHGDCTQYLHPELCHHRRRLIVFTLCHRLCATHLCYHVDGRHSCSQPAATEGGRRLWGATAGRAREGVNEGRASRHRACRRSLNHPWLRSCPRVLLPACSSFLCSCRTSPRHGPEGVESAKNGKTNGWVEEGGRGNKARRRGDSLVSVCVHLSLASRPHNLPLNGPAPANPATATAPAATTAPARRATAPAATPKTRSCRPPAGRASRHRLRLRNACVRPARPVPC